MTAVADVGYGRQFAHFYDRLYPDGEPAAAALAARHPGGGAPALELGVGTGRVALPLARRAGAVVGVDSSPEMLAVLERSRADLPVTPVHADIRGYYDGREYGLVACVCGTLSMVLEPDGQRSVLEASARAVTEDGAVVVETHNPAYVERLHEAGPEGTFSVPGAEQGTALRSRSILDGGARRWRLEHTWFEPGSSREASEVSRLTTPEEIDAYAAGAGLAVEGWFGSWDGAPFTGAEPMVICVYHLEGGGKRS